MWEVGIKCEPKALLLLSKRGSNPIGDEPKEQEMRVSSCGWYVFVYEIRISLKVGE